MTFSTAMNSLKTAVEATGLTYTAGTFDSTLQTASRVKYDGAYMFRVESGAALYQELKLSPEAFSVTITLEIGTTLKSGESFEDAQSRALLRSQKAIEALIANNHTDVVNITRTGTSTVLVNDRQQVTLQQFTLIFQE